MDKLANFQNLPADLVYIATKYIDGATSKTVNFVIREIQLIPTIMITTIDVKLHGFKEDVLYKNAELRLLVPRGCCYIFVNNVHQHTVYGHSKFGSVDDYLPDNEYGNKYTKIVFRRKENGECAHFSAFQCNGITYEIYGSKNVHMVLRQNNFNEDIALYIDQRYSYAVRMAHLIQKQIVTDLQRTQITSYLCLTGNTFCAEACMTDSQHLVKYNESSALFFAVTGFRCNVTESHVKISPAIADDFFRSFGLTPVIETIVIDSSDAKAIETATKHFETQLNSEGAVVSRLNGDNGDVVVHTYKHKNFDYVLKRALREKMRANSSSSMIKHRLKNLHITHPNLKAMIEWGLRFNAYYRSLTTADRLTFFAKFVDWTEKFNALDQTLSEKIYTDFVLTEKTTGTLNVIMFVSIPGSGKSFFARVLTQLLANIGINAIHLEQDMFYEHGKKAAKYYEDAIAKVMNDPNVQYLFLTKSNHCTGVRNSTYLTLSKCTKHVNISYVTITADNDIEKTRDICLERIMLRGFAHKSLYGKTRNELYGILTGTFVNSWEGLTTEEKNRPFVELNIEDDKLTSLANCVVQMQNFGTIPMFTFDDTLLNVAINYITQQDKELEEKNKKEFVPKIRKIGYDAIVLGNIIGTLKAIPNLMNEINLNNLILKTEFHITLAYHGGKLENTLANFIDDEKHVVKIVGFAVDSDALALMVDIGGTQSHTIPHVTIALRKGMNASYSSTLITNAIANDTLIVVDPPMNIQGLTQRIVLASK